MVPKISRLGSANLVHRFARFLDSDVNYAWVWLSWLADLQWPWGQLPARQQKIIVLSNKLFVESTVLKQHLLKALAIFDNQTICTLRLADDHISRMNTIQHMDPFSDCRWVNTNFPHLHWTPMHAWGATDETSHANTDLKLIFFKVSSLLKILSLYLLIFQETNEEWRR